LASLFVVSQTIQGQEGGAKSGPHQVGLIDMAEVFKDYEKFKNLREELQAEIEQSDAQAKGKLEQMKNLQQQITSGQLKQDSPEYQNIEKQLLTMKGELESFRQVQQREFLRKESEIYKQVYLEVQDAVNKYAQHYNLTLIMRFNRNKVEEAENPQEVIQSMNRQVVFHRASDDITDPVLGYLNRQYNSQAAR
ncbi:MAG: OmpH family outer membrane protein, partial [Planctomycetaceae bacterium]|nr:OmpH family outer membrane protein [Planctomycetaceae bacterium]